MAALCLSALPSHTRFLPSLSISPSKFSISSLPFSQYSHVNHQSVRLYTSSTTAFTSTTAEGPKPTSTSETLFDWYSQWYPLATLRDLDKHAPKALTVMELDVVIWWDRVEGTWKVFDDRCPHQLAPLSEGHIDHRGRLQCVYHGWCFDGAGACKYIPQAPALGPPPPVHKNEKACVAVYPSIVQNNILWFWPNTSSQYKDIIQKSKPPYIPELDDPSFSNILTARDLPLETDREGGAPLKITIQKSDINGFDCGPHKFIAPCIVYLSLSRNFSENYGKASVIEQRSKTILLCVPVSPGKCRIVTISTWNFAKWMDKLHPLWCYHIAANLVVDSDLYLLHIQGRKLASEGNNWHKACYAPTQSDAMVIAFRSWLRTYSNNQVNWRTKSSAALPATPTREQLMDRYWSHVVHCKSCSGALRALKAIKVSLQVASIALIGFLAAGKPSITSTITKAAMVSIAVIFFAASLWLPQFIHKAFYYHDYNHATYRTTHLKRILEAFGAFRFSLV